MINFAVGPVQMDEEILAMGSEQIPYFRTPEFSGLMRENERMMCRFMQAPADSRALFLTGSGTAAMEAAVMNVFSQKDRVLVVNGGSFGARFAAICRIHGIPFEEICLKSGCALSEKDLEPYAGRGFTGFLVNACETSTGVLYDMEMIGRFCRENGLLLVVDAVSSFLADDLRMKEWGISLALTGAQKALALPPGLSILVLDRTAVKRVEEGSPDSLYFALREYLKDGLRGQTPFTPAVSILLQLNRRLKGIEAQGIETEQSRIRGQAEDFRNRIRELPLEIATKSPSCAVTPLHPLGRDSHGNCVSAYRIFEVLKDEYGIYVCPNGGELADRIFRVGHIGNLTHEDNAHLVEAMEDMHRRGLL